MAASIQIKHLHNQQIDKTKWDTCIKSADNELLYAYSFYLDHMSQHWDALVLNDYEAVMPLTWNRKYGIAYLYQPFLTAQLGIFGKNITASITDLFIKSIPKTFRYIDILLNAGNNSEAFQNNILLRANYVLRLDKPYEELQATYRENIRRNIKKSVQAGSTIQKGFAVDKVIQLALEQMKKHGKESAENVNRFKKLYSFLLEKEMAITYGIFSAQQQLLSSCVFFLKQNRAYYILVGNHPNGKTLGASHALIDAFIKDYAGQKINLDFEGSDIRNLAFFYSSFGAIQETYPALKINRLPFYFQWLKK